VASPSPAGAAPGQATGALGGQAALDQLVTAANAEGHIVVAGPSPDVYGAALQKFTQAYPKITMDFTAGGGSVHFPRIDAERRGGQYNWDILVGGGGTMFGSFEPAGYLDSVKAALVLPDIVSDQNWIGGFGFGWVDTAKQYVYAFEATIAPVVWVDRDAVPTSQLSTFEQLLDPAWKGKIIMQDPRVAGSGSGALGFMYATKGADYVTKFLQQDLNIVDQQAAVAEALARGTFHVGVGMEVGDIVPYQQQGVGKNIGGLDMTGAGGRLSSGWGNLGLLSKAPHPNAQKVFANWLLSKDGQTTWVAATNHNTSRRTDAPVPEGMTPSNAKSQWTDDEEHFSSENDAKALATQLLK
jgi:iron(III) transport system substrate-binding protein